MTVSNGFNQWWCSDSGGDLWHQESGVPHVEGPHFKCLGETLTERTWNLAHCHAVIKPSVYHGFTVVTNPRLAQVAQLAASLPP